MTRAGFLAQLWSDRHGGTARSLTSLFRPALTGKRKGPEPDASLLFTDILTFSTQPNEHRKLSKVTGCWYERRLPSTSTDGRTSRAAGKWLADAC
jgi:hypothetical protein